MAAVNAVGVLQSSRLRTHRRVSGSLKNPVAESTATSVRFRSDMELGAKCRVHSQRRRGRSLP
jgi:hypothetical protein